MRFVSFLFPGNIDICGERIFIESWNEPIMGVPIHSKGIAEDFKNHFESVWSKSKK